MASVADAAGVERRGGGLWFVLAAMVCALAAGGVAVRLVEAARQQTVVVMARRAVAPLSQVTAGDVQRVKVPRAAVAVGTLRTVAAVAGSYTRMGLVPGEMVTRQAMVGGVAALSAFDVRLARLAGVSGCARHAAPPSVATGNPQVRVEHTCLDLVAMALPASADSGYSVIHTGDHVDVVAPYRSSRGYAAAVVAAGILVLQRISDAQSAAPGVAGGRGSQSGWLVLGLTPKQALRVEAARAAGKVAVLLLPPGYTQPVRVRHLTATFARTAGGSGALPSAVSGNLRRG